MSVLMYIITTIILLLDTDSLFNLFDSY